MFPHVPTHHGSNPDYIGLKQWDVKDEDCRFFVQEMIQKALKGGGWVDFKLKNAFQSMFVQTVDSLEAFAENIFNMDKRLLGIFF